MEYPAAQERPPHRRAKSSVLKSIMVTRSHKKTPSEGAIDPPPINSSIETDPVYSRDIISSTSNPEPVHNPLGEIQPNANRHAPSPKKEKGYKSSKSPHKSKSSMSVKGLFDGSHGPEGGRKSSERSRKKENASPEKPKKSKSSTSLSSVFMKANKSSKGSQNAWRGKEKENTTPPTSAVSDAQTPIWAQFAKGGLEDCSSTLFSPPKSHDAALELKSPYSPIDYTTAEQGHSKGHSEQTPRQLRVESAQVNPGFGTKIPDEQRGERRARSHSRPDCEKRNSRVMAAIAALTGNGKILEADTSDASFKIQGKELDAAFEAVLNERNVPENMRTGMRGLTARVKIDFIMNSRQAPPGAVENRAIKSEEKTSNRRGRSKAPTSAGSDGSKTEVRTSEAQENSAAGTNKHQRSRSKTFMFNKDSLSPTKKRKDSQEIDSSQLESVSMHKSSSSKSLASMGSQSNGYTSIDRKTPKSPEPEEFVSYLRKVQRPEVVEVGKLHKLRLLLRNETVSWVDNFIQQGGMAEITGLLHRIIQVEWREEHEDQLLHEVLLCLKGLCTTDLALRKLCEIQSTLFPALLKMIFDEEKKGPSEFTTRGIVINLLFTHLAAAIPAGIEERTSTILSYLRDPQPSEDSRPLNFIMEMHQSRPYRVWCKEIVSVTKEVFWIFLHHHNVIPLGQCSPEGDTTKQPYDMGEEKKIGEPSKGGTYMSKHFPKARAPVPAAPYIGGVEWDATNYIAAHLDLMNGLIASLPTVQDRNELRSELRASGFEKCMGLSLRTCKEKFYGAVHDCLRTWITAAAEDGWAIEDVRFGPKKEDVSPKKSPAKSRGSPLKKDQGLDALKLDVGTPKLELGLGLDGAGVHNLADDGLGWL
ncbi:hypothetical protein EV356DRAFT_579333 [Viridothelium virens]|uniref:Formin GTPase-binding domain-containing protein n=1 Tax=Viridothelium virens TaxID=1048519 RepID=A0A6A6GZQ3_VIRVR|nr:hypothetical protein EV356DRAFT_579333 [Viridothelium virens]